MRKPPNDDDNRNDAMHLDTVYNDMSLMALLYPFDKVIIITILSHKS
jgi:hypothetical protein